MQFAVIFSADTQQDDVFEWLNFVHPEDGWLQTEGDEAAEDEGWFHRKWFAVLTKEQFETFVLDNVLIASPIPTMGSIGAPGLGLGWSPAICFESWDGNVTCRAYVTPIPEPVRYGKEGFSQRDWDRVRKTVVEIWG